MDILYLDICWYPHVEAKTPVAPKAAPLLPRVFYNNHFLASQYMLLDYSPCRARMPEAIVPKQGVIWGNATGGT
jgi:hypothetical protein